MTNYRRSFACFTLLFLLILFGSCKPEKNTGRKHTGIAKDTLQIAALLERVDTISWYQPDTAIKLAKQAVAISRKAGFDRGVLTGTQTVGTVYMEQGVYDSSIIYYDKALQYALKHGATDTAIIISLYANLAAIHVHWGSYEDALKFQYKAMNMVSGTRFYKLQCLTYNNLGSILYELDRRDKAFYYLDKAKDIAFRVAEANFVLAYIYLNEALLFLRSNQLEACKDKCKAALEANKQHKSTEVQYNATDLMGSIYKLENKPDQAIAMYKSILAMKEEYPAGKIQALISLGNISFELKQYKASEGYLLDAMKRALALNGRRELRRIYERLSNIYREQRHYEQSLDYQDKLVALKDSMLDMEKVQSVNLLEIKYQTAEKNKEIAENKLKIADQNARIVRKNILITAIVIGILIVLLASWFFYSRKQRLQKQKQEAAVWHAMVEGEEKERSRIAHDLHDGIGGLLSTLKMYFGIMKKRVPAIAALDIYQDATQLLDDTVNEVRKTAHNLMPELLLNHGLSEAVRIYCNAIQGDKGLKIDFQYYGFIGDLNSGFQLSLYRIIQELIQNILKHAGASLALVQLSQHNEFLDITVEDNGVGMPADKINHGGIGLQSIRRRVKELQGNFHINSSPGNGTTIYIEFNLLQQKDNQE
jgi:signal transduction histidine kinase